ncbi:hypothetical protein D3C72_1585290 [compost metagenome]
MSDMLLDARIAFSERPLHVSGLHGADIFLARTDDHPHAIVNDLFGRGRDRHQARSALAINSLPGHTQWQAGGQCAHAPQIPACGTTRHGGAHHQVFDFTGFDPCPLYGSRNGKRRHAGRLETIERALERLGDGGSGS